MVTDAQSIKDDLTDKHGIEHLPLGIANDYHSRIKGYSHDKQAHITWHIGDSHDYKAEVKVFSISRISDHYMAIYYRDGQPEWAVLMDRYETNPEMVIDAFLQARLEFNHDRGYWFPQNKRAEDAMNIMDYRPSVRIDVEDGDVDWNMWD